MKKRTAWILVAAVAAVAMGAAAVGVVALLLRGGGGPSLSGGKSYLVLDVEGSFPEQTSADINSLFERRPPPLRALIESLDRAARDPAVAGAVVR